jgi:hypothetical protein
MENSMRLLPCVLFLACVGRSNGLVKPSCEATATVVDDATVTALGYSAADLVANLRGPVSETLNWSRGGSDTTITAELVGDPGEARFLDGDAGEGADCPDRMEVDASVRIATGDGAFAETWAVTLVSEGATAASFTQDLDAVELVGTFDKWDHADPSADYESLGASMQVNLESGGSSGEITLDGAGWSDPDCTEEGCTAWESHETAAAWGDGI